METCFVIQRLDASIYDKRYRETFAPAIERGGVTPIRADEVLGTHPVIEKIIDNLRRSLVVFAEISEDNANVFLELGFALAMQIPSVLVCDRSKRSKLPFDVAHRPVLFYSTDSSSDFNIIEKQVEENIAAARVEALQNLQSRASQLTSEVATDDLDAVMQMCLLECLESDLRSPDGTPIYSIQRSIVSERVSDRMVNLAVAKLIDDKLLESASSYDEDNRQNYNAIRLTESGRKFVLRSYALLKRTEEDRLSSLPTKKPKPAFGATNTFDGLDNDVPF